MKNNTDARLRRKIFWLILTPIMLLSSCAVPRQPVTLPMKTAPLAEDANEIGWYRISFEITWPKDQEPFWYMDALLADRVVAPVLEQYRGKIRSWRFHRRANRDAAGHRFSFIFYTSGFTAAQIIATIKQQPPLQRLLSGKQLVRVDYADPKVNNKPNIEDTSDPIWPLMVQKTWPSFIMGASDMWLGLVHELAQAARKNEKNNDETLYREVQKQLSAFWREQGQHPLLHHLNALFGYEEMIVIDRNGRSMRF
jgi:hypothetical protein